MQCLGYSSQRGPRGVSALPSSRAHAPFPAPLQHSPPQGQVAPVPSCPGTTGPRELAGHGHQEPQGFGRLCAQHQCTRCGSLHGTEGSEHRPGHTPHGFPCETVQQLPPVSARPAPDLFVKAKVKEQKGDTLARTASKGNAVAMAIL